MGKSKTKNAIDERTDTVVAGQPFTDDFAKERADRFDCAIEYADDRTLQIDIDSDEAFCEFERRFHIAHKLGLPLEEGYSVRRSRSGNRHVVVALQDDTPDMERVLLQSLLGSDAYREMMCYGRLKRGHPNPICFFRPVSGRQGYP